MGQPSVSLDKTTQYVYNGIGNIESVTTTGSTGTTSTQSFTYGDTANPDRLTQFGTKAITYNTMGCPLSYDGRSFNWNNGKLKTITKGSVKDWSLPYEAYTYTYNAKGQRTSKSYFYRPEDSLSLIGAYLKNTNTSYTYDNSGRLIREKRTLTYSDFSTLAIEFIYLYDESGIIGVQFTYGDEAPQLFYYQRNLQGDVVAIYNTSGVLQAKYSYDAWGNCTVANSTNVQIANYNPIRYRGYYLDSETNWYFLNARYYSPEWRRFVSPDDTAYLDPETPNGLNLYCYCGNDPINYCDPSGCFAITLSMILTTIGVSAMIGMGTALGSTIVKDLQNGSLFDGDITWKSYLGNTLGGGIAGLGIGFCSILGVGLGLSLSAGAVLTICGTAVTGGTALAYAVGGALVTGGLGYAVRTSISDQEQFELTDMFIDAGANAISGLLTFTGSMAGGILGIKVPNTEFSLKNFAFYHLGSMYFGVYPLKILFSYIKGKLKEIY